MLIVAIAGLLVNILALWILSRGDNEHVNIRGAIAHVLGDLLGSIGAIMAAIIIYYTNWTPVDPILSIIVSLLILRTAVLRKHRAVGEQTLIFSYKGKKRGGGRVR